MDCVKIGKLIAKLRKKKNLTQKNIADALGIQSKTVSKWECGLGCPDLSLWPELSAILGVDMNQLMEGEITPNKPDSGNIEKIRFYVCSTCGNIWLVQEVPLFSAVVGNWNEFYLGFIRYNKNYSRGNRD